MIHSTCTVLEQQFLRLHTFSSIFPWCQNVEKRGESEKPNGGWACVDFNQVKVKCHVRGIPGDLDGRSDLWLWMAELEEGMPCSMPTTRQKDDYMMEEGEGFSGLGNSTAAYGSWDLENISLQKKMTILCRCCTD